MQGASAQASRSILAPGWSCGAAARAGSRFAARSPTSPITSTSSTSRESFRARPSRRSVLDEAILGSGRVGDLHHELEQLQRDMSDPAKAGDLDRILARFGEVQEEYDHLGGYALEAQAREVLLGLGFDDERIDGDVGALSGGWKMRVAMARVLLGRPDVLLMDEPTNHLDIESIIWLEGFLTSLPGAL